MWVSTIGTWAHNTAVVLLIRDLGGGGVELGVAAACQFGPMLLLGLKAGALADRSDRYRRTMHFSMVLAIIALTLGVIVFSDAVNIGIVYAMTLMFGTASAFENPTRRSFVTDLVPSEQVGNVLSLNTTVMTGARMFGPAIAAVIATATSVGWVFLLNGLSYVALLVAMRQIDRSRLHTVTMPPQVTPPRCATDCGRSGRSPSCASRWRCSRSSRRSPTTTPSACRCSSPTDSTRTPACTAGSCQR